MTSLTSFFKTDGVDDHVAADVNDLIAATLRSEYKNIETLSATRTLLDVDTPIQRYECGAADRIVKMPSADAVGNHPYWIINASAGARMLTVQNNGGSVTHITLSQGKAVLMLPDGNGGYLVSSAASIGNVTDARLLGRSAGSAGDMQEITVGAGLALMGGVLLVMETDYKITPTVVSNDLVLTLTHADGTTPSAVRPLYFKIGNSWRAVTAALSVTKPDATNWAGLGGAMFATLEADLFEYLVWNTNLTPDAVDIFWSRIPYGRLYSDFSATTTNEKYAAINATAPAATDECVCVGRFAATLSGGGFTWSVPTFTNSNLIQRPIYETRYLSWLPTWNITVGSATQSALYQLNMYNMRMRLSLTWAADTAGAATTEHSLPMEAKMSDAADRPSIGFINARDASPTAQYPCIASLISTTTVRGKTQNAAGTSLALAEISTILPFTWTTSDVFEEVSNYRIANS